ncbi:hypothetical protein L21SP3_00290 [Sedimentisphaera cyanobacteriorum]|uniref:DUF697 domain-containing protein n=1 Tax=Sedimentisphaera cyanobacteriorum TaxID=1940790 RepID=A0A1Q2HLZ1_9BACT|nr:DUF697 domain-containing protein [Sedimentisphaera cyanobacteriorum]AQQ08507.1 hypothetical protein L21SP3_00290 [Sedimentisphaera cyanobacteriorum]
MQDENDSLGDPLSEDFSEKKKAQEKPDPKTNPKNNPQPENSEQYRPGDDGLGMPEDEAEDIRVIKEQAGILEDEQQLSESEQQEQFERKLRELESFSRFLRFPAGLKKILTLILLIAAGVCGLLIVSQGCSFFNELNQLTQGSEILRISLMSLFGLFALLILFSIARLLFFTGRLKTSQGINVQALNTLSERTELQKAARKRKAEARKELQQYLKDYPLKRDKAEKLITSGLKKEDIHALTKARDRLLDENTPLSDTEWLNEYKRIFQSTLDKAAARIVSRYSLKAGAATAASPVSFVDQAMVIYVCVSMTQDLIRIYNLRPAAGQSLIMLSFSIINIYISGALEESTERFMESVSENIPGGISGTFQSILGKASEGTLNGLLIWRLGRRVTGFLMPVK